jgi:hypothetical protein
MGILEILFGARKPKGEQQKTPTFDEINVQSDYSKKSVDSARGDCRGTEWSQLEEKLRRLPIANKAKAEVLLSELHKGENYSKAPSLDAATCFAAQRTSHNGGNFAELVSRAEAKSHPVPYLMALHSWRGIGDSFGTKASYFVRVAENTWLCAGQTRYGT